MVIVVRAIESHFHHDVRNGFQRCHEVALRCGNFRCTQGNQGFLAALVFLEFDQQFAGVGQHQAEGQCQQGLEADIRRVNPAPFRGDAQRPLSIGHVQVAFDRGVQRGAR